MPEATPNPISQGMLLLLLVFSAVSSMLSFSFWSDPYTLLQIYHLRSLPKKSYYRNALSRRNSSDSLTEGSLHGWALRIKFKNNFTRARSMARESLGSDVSRPSTELVDNQESSKVLLAERQINQQLLQDNKILLYELERLQVPSIKS